MVDDKTNNRSKRVVSKISGKYKKDIRSPNGIMIIHQNNEEKVTKALHNVTM